MRLRKLILTLPRYEAPRLALLFEAKMGFDGRSHAQQPPKVKMPRKLLGAVEVSL